MISFDSNGTEGEAEEYFNKLHVVVAEYFQLYGGCSPANEGEYMHRRELLKLGLAELLEFKQVFFLLLDLDHILSYTVGCVAIPFISEFLALRLLLFYSGVP